MMPSSINSQTFKLLEKSSTNKITTAAVTYHAIRDTATLDPTNSLRSRVTYKAVVTIGGAKDLAGNPLDQNPTTGLQQKAWSFTVSN